MIEIMGVRARNKEYLHIQVDILDTAFVSLTSDYEQR